MMGNKKLTEIRAELAKQLDRQNLEPAEWYEQQLQKLRGKTQPDQADLDSLKLIRDALASLRETAPAPGE
jgi:hypothetical protein